MSRLSRIVVLLAAVLLLFPTLKGNALPEGTDRRITEVYGSYTARLSSAQLADLNGRLLRCTVKQMPLQKGESFPLLSKQPLVTKFVPDLRADSFSEPTKINPLKYDLPFYTRKDLIYRIDGTDYVLFVIAKAP
ncbi:hypothetical protein [Taibaiella koreensis]|uniref:hypothetical protein n=1 Tax=Taibaiella koreensis TaxID=1268548 RepID=UPI000E59E006|nr:hypothetical protein [Taibaiella koreensis]